jgi:hypothetical protein
MLHRVPTVRRIAKRQRSAAMLLALSTLLLPLNDSTAAAEAPTGVAKESFHLYLLLGQSNMAGRGKMQPRDRRPVPHVYMLDAENRWVPASHPLHFDKPSMAGVGLGIDFATTLRDEHDEIVIGLIPCAVGGTRLDQWQKGSPLYRQTLERAAIGALSGVLRGILWHQGESDSTPDAAPTYAERLTKLFADLRSDLQAADLPIVVGELGPFRQQKNEYTAVVNRELAKLAHDDPRTSLATASGLRDSGDLTHFDAESLREFGRRYAAAMQTIRNNKASAR